jgi:outer membrane protein assembly factor BamB
MRFKEKVVLSFGSIFVMFLLIGTMIPSASGFTSQTKTIQCSGNIVAVGGNTVVTGQTIEDGDGGYSSPTVQVCNARTGKLIYTLTSPYADDLFYGRAVATNGRVVVVSDLAGPLWIYSASSPRLIRTLHATGPVSLAVSDSILVVGAWSYRGGHVYVYNVQTGKLLQNLSSPNMSPGQDGFGGSVAIHGNMLVVGSPGEIVNGVNEAGRVYIFNILNGRLLAALSTPNPQQYGGFGSSVGLTHNFIAVGAPDTGRVYLYKGMQNPQLIRTFIDPNGQNLTLESGQFGWSIALHKGILTVDDVGGPAYIFNARTGRLIMTEGTVVCCPPSTSLAMDSRIIAFAWGSSVTVLKI